MLRPDHIIELFKSRAKLNLSDHHQLVDGLSIGGTIVVGGGPTQVQRLMPVLTQFKRVGAVSSLQELDPRKLDLRKTITFDLAAIAQLLILSKNETFHATIDQALSLLQKACAEDGHTIEEGLQILRQTADEVTRM